MTKILTFLAITFVYVNLHASLQIEVCHNEFSSSIISVEVDGGEDTIINLTLGKEKVHKKTIDDNPQSVCSSEVPTRYKNNFATCMHKGQLIAEVQNPSKNFYYQYKFDTLNYDLISSAKLFNNKYFDNKLCQENENQRPQRVYPEFETIRFEKPKTIRSAEILEQVEKGIARSVYVEDEGYEDELKEIISLDYNAVKINKTNGQIKTVYLSALVEVDAGFSRSPGVTVRAECTIELTKNKYQEWDARDKRSHFQCETIDYDY